MRTKTIKKVVRSFLSNIDIPEIPYLNPKRTNLTAFVLGGVGVAVVGGLAAWMVFSPRTRTRALGMAKDAYGRVGDTVNEKLSQFKDERLDQHEASANGLAGRSAATYEPSTPTASGI